MNNRFIQADTSCILCRDHNGFIQGGTSCILYRDHSRWIIDLYRPIASPYKVKKFLGEKTSHPETWDTSWFVSQVNTRKRRRQ